MTKHLNTKYDKVRSKLLAYIEKYWKDYIKGPSYREIASNFGNVSSSTVGRWIDRLNEEGEIEIDAHIIYPKGLRRKIADVVNEHLKK